MSDELFILSYDCNDEELKQNKNISDEIGIHIVHVVTCKWLGLLFLVLQTVLCAFYDKFG